VATSGEAAVCFGNIITVIVKSIYLGVQSVRSNWALTKQAPQILKNKILYPTFLHTSRPRPTVKMQRNAFKLTEQRFGGHRPVEGQLYTQTKVAGKERAPGPRVCIEMMLIFI